MSLSGSISTIYTAQQLIDMALKKIGVLGEGETSSGNQYTEAQDVLNLLMKTWSMEGPNLWTDAEQTVPLVSGLATYVLSPRPRQVYNVRWCNDIVTNRALYARDWTQANWTASNMTTALSQTGVDNVASSATLLTASAGNATVLQSVTRAEADWDFGLYMKRVTGTGAISLTLDGGATYTAVTDDINSDTWTQVGISQDDVTNPSFGVKITTSGDAVAIDYAMASLDGISPTAFEPILTTTANASRYDEGRPLGEWGKQDYDNSPIKDQMGDPCIFVLSRARTQTTITLWPIPSFTSGNYAVRIGYERVWEDVTAAAQDIDVPQEWFETLLFGLAGRLADDYQLTGPHVDRVRARALQLYDLAMTNDRRGDVRVRIAHGR